MSWWNYLINSLRNTFGKNVIHQWQFVDMKEEKISQIISTKLQIKNWFRQALQMIIVHKWRTLITIVEMQSLCIVQVQWTKQFLWTDPLHFLLVLQKKKKSLQLHLLPAKQKWWKCHSSPLPLESSLWTEVDYDESVKALPKHPQKCLS